MQQHPDETDLRDQLITYVLGESDLTVQELQELLNNIFSPVLKREVMYSGNGFLAVAAREAAAKERAEAQIEIDKAKRETAEIKTVAVMQSWHGGVSSSLIAAMAGLKPNKVTQLIETFEKVKAHRAAKAKVSKAELQQLSGLSETELKVLLTLLQQH